MHELLHTLGIMHTHQRHDRDEFIDYNEACVDIEDDHDLDKLNQFNKSPEAAWPTLGVPYKCNSIMHYTGDQLGYPNCTVLRPRSDKPECKELGNTSPLPEDWQLVNIAHGCANLQST